MYNSRQLILHTFFAISLFFIVYQLHSTSNSSVEEVSLKTLQEVLDVKKKYTKQLRSELLNIQLRDSSQHTKDLLLSFEHYSLKMHRVFSNLLDFVQTEQNPQKIEKFADKLVDSSFVSYVNSYGKMINGCNTSNCKKIIFEKGDYVFTKGLDKHAKIEKLTFWEREFSYVSPIQAQLIFYILLNDLAQTEISYLESLLNDFGSQGFERISPQNYPYGL